MAMAITTNLFISAILIMASLDFTVGQIGVSYGRLGDGLPSASEVVNIYNQNNIQRMRIYDPDQPTLQALSGSNIELTMGVPNINDLEYVAASQANADDWVQNNVKNYPDVRFRHIIVGNEVSPIRGDTSQYVPFVLQAMQNVQNSIAAAGLGDQIKVSTAIDMGVLDKSYPPEDGVFRSDVTSYLNPIIQFLVSTGAPLFVNVYPYFAYVGNEEQINLEYALLQPNNGIVVPSGVTYDNLFYALVDAMYAALEKSIGGSSTLENSDDGSLLTPELKVTESGWPHKGGKPHITSVENARIYINNLIGVVKNGTPKRPGRPIETHIFAMFDENQKDGDEVERNFGIFQPDGNPIYPISFN